MNKHLLTLLLVFLINITSLNAQKIELDGSWVCTAITDENGVETNGTLAASSQYLKINFKGNKLALSNSPVDRGEVKFFAKFDQNYMYLRPTWYRYVSDTVYFVEKSDDTHLTLIANKNSKDAVYYHFVNEQSLPIDKSGTLDLGLFVLRYQKVTSNLISGFPISDYILLNPHHFLKRTPIFYDYDTKRFGNYLSKNFNLSTDLLKEDVSKELLVEFDVGKEGVENIFISKSASLEIDAEVFRILDKSKKKWSPIVINGEVITTRMIFHVIICYGESAILITPKTVSR